MGRTLSVALAQYRPITGADPVGQLHAQAAEIQRDSTDLELIAFPEIHLCGDCDNAVDSNEWLRSAAEPLEIDRSLCRLNNIVLDPSHDWVNKMYIKSEADQLNNSTDDFSEILGKWHQFKVDVEKPCTLPRSKFYKSGYLR